jgi:CheY-like chemotaxis protein
MSIKQLDVLVVDDHRLIREMIGHVLGALECKRIRNVSDGAAAFVEIVSAPPDLVICDFHMPITGLQLLNKVRRSPESPDTALPVVIMTSLTDRKRIEALRDAGATEIIAKPFTAAAVLSRIAAVIDSPRPFVMARNFIGPCRRRRADPDYLGPLRRASDKAVVEL